MATVNLGDEGLSAGDAIDPYLDDFWQSGNEVIIPDGQYQCDDLGSFECDGDAVLTSDGHATIDYGHQSHGGRFHLATDAGDLTIEHVTLQGTLTSGGSAGFKLFVNGGLMEFIDFGFHMDTPDGGNTIGFLLDDGSSGGSVVFENCHISRASNNGIYFSQVNSVDLTVRGSILEENNIDQIRCGGDGDLIEGNLFLMENAPPDYAAPTGRGVRTQEDGNVTIRNNDFCYTWSGSEPAIVFAGDSSEVINSATVENNRIQHNGPSVVIDHRHTDVGDRVSGHGNHLTGSTTDVHSSYEHLISCRGGGCDTPDCSGAGGAEPPEGDVFEVIAPSSGEIEYEYVVEGVVHKHQTSGDIWAGSNDTISSNGDGTVTVTGRTGNGYGDAFIVDGTFRDFAVTSGSSATLRLNGDEVSPSDIVPDPCEGVDCGTCETCEDGDCVPVPDPCCGVSCGDCETCVGGECVPVDDPCCGVTCGDGEVCQGGECVSTGPGPNPCEDVSCGDCETCEDGDCVPVDDPCCGVTCGDCETCEGGDCVAIPDCESTKGGMSPAMFAVGAVGLGAAVSWFRERRSE